MSSEETKVPEKVRQGLNVIAIWAMQAAQEANCVGGGEPPSSAAVGKALDRIEARVQETRRLLVGAKP